MKNKQVIFTKRPVGIPDESIWEYVESDVRDLDKDEFLIKNHYINLRLLKNINKIFKKGEVNKIVYFMKKDKKNIDDKINLILLSKIGKTTKPKKIALKASEVKKFLNSYYN